MVEVILKGKITAAASSNSLWTKNWDEELLPANLSKNAQALGRGQVQGDLGSQGKVVRSGSGGFGSTKGPGLGKGKSNDRSPKRRRRRRSSGSDTPDFGGNANMVPLGGGKMKQKIGNKAKKEKKGESHRKFTRRKIKYTEEPVMFSV